MRHQHTLYAQGTCIIFSLVCTLKRLFRKIDVKVDVQKGALRFRDFFDNNRCVSFIQLKFSSVVIMR